LAAGEQRGLLPAQELLDDDTVAGRSEDAVAEEEAEGAPRVLLRLRHEDALAARQAVGLEDDRISEPLDRAPGLVLGRANHGIGRRDPVAPEKLLRKPLRRLDLSGETSRSEDRQLPLLEFVHDAEGKGQFGPDDRQVDVQLLGEIGNLDDVSGRDRQAIRDFRDAGIARSTEDLLDHGAAMERPAQGVLPPASADDEDFHCAALYRRPRPRTDCAVSGEAGACGATACGGASSPRRRPAREPARPRTGRVAP
jgi:hypothetical protein